MSHAFSHFENETITIIGLDGARSAPQKAQFDSDKFILFAPKISVEEGSVVERPTYGTNVEQWDVQHVEYSAKFHSIPAKITLTAKKRGSLLKKGASVTNQTINFNGPAQGVQVGNQNVQNIDISLRDLIAKIDNSSASAEEKKEAKSRLARFLEHPIVSAFAGAVATAALGS